MNLPSVGLLLMFVSPTLVADGVCEADAVKLSRRRECEPLTRAGYSRAGRLSTKKGGKVKRGKGENEEKLSSPFSPLPLFTFSPCRVSSPRATLLAGRPSARRSR